MIYKVINYEVKLKRKRDHWCFTNVINSSEDCIQIIKKLYNHEDREKLYVILLNGRKKVIGTNLVAVGTADSVMIHPREVFKVAILTGASGLIMVHNHISGDAVPSQADIEMTDRIIESGNILDIPLFDHIIYSEKRFYSMSDQCDYPINVESEEE